MSNRKIIRIKVQPTSLMSVDDIAAKVKSREMTLEQGIAAAHKNGYVALIRTLERKLIAVKNHCKDTILALVRRRSLTVEEGLRHAMLSGIDKLELEDFKRELARAANRTGLTYEEQVRRDAAFRAEQAATTAIAA